MAENNCSVVSHNVNGQGFVSAAQRQNFTEEKTEKVMEVMLLEDCKYDKEPQTVTNLLEYLRAHGNALDKNDVLVGFIYILMLEYGFVPSDYKEPVHDSNFNYQRLLKLSKKLPDKWKGTNSYQLNFMLKSEPEHKITVTCVAMTEDLILNCVVDNLNNFSIILDPLIYFVSSMATIHAFKYQNLDHLSRIFKSQMCYPVKCLLMSEINSDWGSLECLPEELILYIMSFLKMRPLLNLSTTCSLFHNLMKNRKIWARRLFFDFKQNTDLATYTEVRSFYASLYKYKYSHVTMFKYRY